MLRSSPEYHKMISKPMDLTIIHQKFKDGEYSNCDKFICDIRSLKSWERSNLVSEVQSMPAQLFEDLLSNVLTAVSDDGRLICQWFKVSLPKELYPEYYACIEEPMDLQTMARKIRNRAYKSLDDMESDMLLLCTNAGMFNEPHSTAAKVFLRCVFLVFPDYYEETTKPVSFYTINRNIKVVRYSFSKRCQFAFYRKVFTEVWFIFPSLTTWYDAVSNGQSGLKLFSSTQDSSDRRLSAAFMDKPSRKKYPDYYQVIPEPIDLRTIRSSIEADRYPSSNSMAADFDLLFENAKHYNEDGSVIYQDATTLSNVFRERVSCRKRSGSYSSDSSAKALLKRGKHDERDSKLWQLYNHIKDFADSKGRVLSTIFIKLPSRMEYPDYYEVIKKPIDMQKIYNRISSNHYENLDALVADIALMFDNACKYNDPESQIYKDALMLQRLLLLKKSELQADEPKVIDVQHWVQEMVTSIFLDEDGRCYADSLYEFAAANDQQGFRKFFTLDQIKKNIDKKRYRRLDRFQEDMFAMFRNVRENFPPDSQVSSERLKNCTLQSCFIRTRNELTKEGDVFYSPALSYAEKDLNAEVQEQKCHSDGQEMASVVVRDVVYNVGDFVYVKPTEAGLQPHILFLKRMWKTGEKYEVLAYGNWFYRPSETFHTATRKFLDHEVFITDFFDKIDTQRIMGKCYVIIPLWYSNAQGFMDEDVYVCESKYLGRVKHFKKLRTWEMNCSESDVLFEERLVPLVPIRKPFVFAGRESADIETSPNVDDVDSDSESQTSVLEMERCVTILSIDSCSKAFLYRNLFSEATQPKKLLSTSKHFWVKLGDCVYLAPREVKPNILHVERIWKANAETWISGVTFVFPCQIEHEPTRLFYKNEIFAVENRKEYPISRITGLCSVLSVKSYCCRRHLFTYHFRPSPVVRKRIMAENPDCSFGDISKIVGSEWKKLSDEEKKRYEEEAQRIADQRAKADMAAGSRLQLLPGQTRVYCCRWRECDYQFESADQLNDHITSAHTSQIGMFSLGDDQYVCLWLTCSKYRKEGKPFPSLPRLHRHIKEKHLPSSVKCIYNVCFLCTKILIRTYRHYVPLPVTPCADNAPIRMPVPSVDQQQSLFGPVGTMMPNARFPKVSQEQVPQAGCFPQPTTSQTQLSSELGLSYSPVTLPLLI
ncbi:protein polybromo 1 [Trichuris trichiura]|uniref:Protein polybromo 1 n=1 Tax=Trichuris trichiura TaxID=36087 RepID=A0A077ZHD0_TRITR|nr:protein polybromo 1 [Trichuris trichiura]